MRIFDLRTRNAAADDHSRRLRRRISPRKAACLDFLTGRHGEIRGSRSSSQLQQFIEECWSEMEALSLTWKPSVSTLHRALTLLDRETRDPHPQRTLI